MLQTHSPANRVTVAEDALAALTLTVLSARPRRRIGAPTAAERARRRADRAVRQVLRHSGAPQAPRA